MRSNSTNPFYKGNVAGVVAHLRNTIRLEFNPPAFETWEDQIEALTDAITQRWHLIPAQHVGLMDREFESENIKLRGLIEQFNEIFDAATKMAEINNRLNDLSQEMTSIQQEGMQLEKEGIELEQGILAMRSELEKKRQELGF